MSSCCGYNADWLQQWLLICLFIRAERGCSVTHIYTSTSPWGIRSVTAAALTSFDKSYERYDTSYERYDTSYKRYDTSYKR